MTTALILSFGKSESTKYILVGIDLIAFAILLIISNFSDISN